MSESLLHQAENRAENGIALSALDLS